MENRGKQGEVYLQHQKHGEKWKHYWLSLHPASRQGVARLELSEAAQERSSVVVRKHPERKVMRLADCVSVVKLPPHAEACPGENMSAFCVEMEDKRLVFAADRESVVEWVDVICKNAFQSHLKSCPQPTTHMEDNQIYMSREQLSEFKVVVLQSEASNHCGLKGQYWLQVGEGSLSLQDLQNRKSVMEWPYKLLRRYGSDKMLFSIEAGRRCDSGPGTFNFESRQSEEIFRLIESSIRQQKSLTIAGEKHYPHSPRSRSPRSPLPKRPQSFPSLDSVVAINSPNPEDLAGPNIYTSFNPSITKPASPCGSIEAVYADPVTLRSSSQIPHSDPACSIEPVYSTSSVLIGKQEPVYAQPEVIKSDHSIKSDTLLTHNKEDLEPVYADPLDVLHQKLAPTNPITIDSQPSKKDKCSEPVYSEVYGHLNLHSSQKSDLEPIYSVPDVSQSTQNNNTQQIPEENQPIYSRVIKTLPHEKRVTQTEIVSEDLGLI